LKMAGIDGWGKARDPETNYSDDESIESDGQSSSETEQDDSQSNASVESSESAGDVLAAFGDDAAGRAGQEMSAVEDVSPEELQALNERLLADPEIEQMGVKQAVFSSGDLTEDLVEKSNDYSAGRVRKSPTEDSGTQVAALPGNRFGSFANALSRRSSKSGESSLSASPDTSRRPSLIDKIKGARNLMSGTATPASVLEESLQNRRGSLTSLLGRRGSRQLESPEIASRRGSVPRESASSSSATVLRGNRGLDSGRPEGYRHVSDGDDADIYRQLESFSFGTPHEQSAAPVAKPKDSKREE
jgi:hypothetical protein